MDFAVRYKYKLGVKCSFDTMCIRTKKKKNTYQSANVRFTHSLVPAGMAARFGLTLVFVALRVLAFTPHTAADPCLQSRLQSAFLKGVVDGLPADVQATFCDNTPSQVAVHGEDTGVQHFVLSGHVPQRLLGKTQGRWQRIGHNRLSSRGPNAHPVLLHLWIKALCSGYKSKPASQHGAAPFSTSKCFLAAADFCSGCITPYAGAQPW